MAFVFLSSPEKRGLKLDLRLHRLELTGTEPERIRRQRSFFEDSVPELEGFSDLEAARVSAALGGG